MASAPELNLLQHHALRLTGYIREERFDEAMLELAEYRRIFDINKAALAAAGQLQTQVEFSLRMLNWALQSAIASRSHTAAALRAALAAGKYNESRLDPQASNGRKSSVWSFEG
jgi:hypothetical protein